MQQRREVTEILVLAASMGAFDMQKAGGCAIGQRLLRNQLFGKLIMEVGDQHAKLIIGTSLCGVLLRRGLSRKGHGTRAIFSEIPLFLPSVC